MNHVGGSAYPFATAVPVSAADLLSDPRRVPCDPGIYGWLMDPQALGLDAAGCDERHGWPLLYLGVAQVRQGSSRHLRDRIVGNHLRGNAGASTLRRSVGSILRERLGLQLRRGRSPGGDSWGEG